MAPVFTFWVKLFREAYGILAGLTFVLVTFSTVCMLAVVPGEHNRRRLVKTAASLMLRLIGAHPAVTGLEYLPEGACVLAANHASYIDGVVLTAALPPRFTFVIKREMTKVPLAHFLLRRIGSEFVDRFDSHRGGMDIRRILAQAECHCSLVFFPEGTFAGRPGLGRFHNGAFVAAARADAAVVPIVIRGSRQMLPAGRWLPHPSRIKIIIKPPIRSSGNDKPVYQLMRACRQSILEDLDEPDLAT